MSDNKEYVYNTEHMSEIAEKIRKCGSAVNSAIDDNGKAAAYLENDYLGQAEEISMDTLAKISEHLKALYKCCQAAEAYVNSSLSDMQDLDRDISGRLQKGKQ